MPLAKKKKQGVVNPTRISAFDEDKKVQVIIETPKGSRNKYAWDPEQQVFALKKVLPEGMVFPHDFGFIPSTEGDDGDPIDVLVLMDQPVFTGCLVKARLVGVIEGKQTEEGKSERNDRLLAVDRKTEAPSPRPSVLPVCGQRQIDLLPRTGCPLDRKTTRRITTHSEPV
jgi:inorganic pyrophosphatase